MIISKTQIIKIKLFIIKIIIFIIIIKTQKGLLIETIQVEIYVENSYQ